MMGGTHKMLASVGAINATTYAHSFHEPLIIVNGDRTYIRGLIFEKIKGHALGDNVVFMSFKNIYK